MQNSQVKVSRRYKHPCSLNSKWKANSWIDLIIQIMFSFQNIFVIYDFGAKAIDHGRFKGERLVKEALHSGPQSVNRCVSLPVQYQAIQTRTNHKEVRRIQAEDQPGAGTDPPADEAPTRGPRFTGPITRARARMMAQAGQTRDNPPPS